MTSQYIRYPSTGGGSAAIPTYANLAALPATAADGAAAITLDNDRLYIFNLATTTWILAGGSGVPLLIGTLDSESSPSANVLTIQGPQLIIQSASATAPGVVNTGSQTFAGGKTFGNITSTGTIQGNNLALPGTSTAYIGGDGAAHTLNQASVAGLTTASSPTFTGLTLSGMSTAGIVHNSVTTGLLTSSLVVNADVSASAAIATSKLAAPGTSTQLMKGDFSVSATPANGSLPIGNGTGVTIATLAAGATAGVSITNASGSITLDTVQDIRTTASPTFAAINLTSSGNLAGQRNFLLNSGALVAQRGSGFQSTNNVYNIDRWVNNFSGTAGTISAVTSSFASSSPNCFHLATASSGSTQVTLFSPNATLQTAQLIGQTVTLSCKVRKSAGLAAGDFGMRILTTTVVDDTYANQSTGTAQVTNIVPNASLTTTFQTVFATVTLPTNVRSICVSLNLINSPTASQYLEFTDVMLNLGSVPAPYQLCNPTFEAEFRELQCYYETLGTGILGIANSTTAMTLGLRYAIAKRITPILTLLVTNPSFFNVSLGGNSTASGATITGVGTNDTYGTSFGLTGFSGLTLGQAAFSQTVNVFGVAAEIT